MKIASKRDKGLEGDCQSADISGWRKRDDCDSQQHAAAGNDQHVDAGIDAGSGKAGGSDLYDDAGYPEDRGFDERIAVDAGRRRSAYRIGIGADAGKTRTQGIKEGTKDRRR